MTTKGIRNLVLLALVLVLGACAGRDPLMNLPLYTSIGATVIKTELATGVTTLPDAELLARRKIMGTVVPITNQLDDLAVSYKAALDAEADRRSPSG
jgi:hypothetical protein